MSVKPHLQTNLSQRLVLTPQMRQRIEMLQMTKLELSDMIIAEMEQNPVLEEALPGESADEQLDGTTDEETRPAAAEEAQTRALEGDADRAEATPAEAAVDG